MLNKIIETCLISRIIFLSQAKLEKYNYLRLIFLQAFKKIVEDLLSELMSELGVTEEQFVDACEKASLNPLHKKIVDQITAVDNFTAFKKLMVKRNQELNEQALQMLSGKNKAGGSAEGEPQTQPKKRKPRAAASTTAGAEVSGQTLPSVEMSEEQREMLRKMQEEDAKEEEEMVRKAMELSAQLE